MLAFIGSYPRSWGKGEAGLYGIASVWAQLAVGMTK